MCKIRCNKCGALFELEGKKIPDFECTCQSKEFTLLNN